MTNQKRKSITWGKYLRLILSWLLVIVLFAESGLQAMAATDVSGNSISGVSTDPDTVQTEEEETEAGTDESTEGDVTVEGTDEPTEGDVTGKETGESTEGDVTGEETGESAEGDVTGEEAGESTEGAGTGEGTEESTEGAGTVEGTDVPTEEVEAGENTEGDAPAVWSLSNNIIYTDGSVDAGADEDGSYDYPFKNLPDAIAACPDGGTVIVKSGGGYSNDELSTDSPLLITKNITIQGEESTYPSINIRNGSIILGGDVTIENVSLSITNTTFKGIFANGYKLTLNNVSNSNSEVVLPDVYVGSYSGYTGTEVTTDTVDNCGEVVIYGAESKFDEVFAGSYGSAWNQDSKISVMDDGSGSLTAVYSCGSTDDSGTFDVNGNVIITLTNPTVKNVYGYVNSTAKAEVVFSDEYANEALNLTDVGKLTVGSGTYIPPALDSGMDIVVHSGGILDLSAVLAGNQDFVVNNFTGGGILRLNQDQCVTMEGTVTGTTNLESNDNRPMDGSSSGIVAEGHVYIITPEATADDAFSFVPYMTQEDFSLVKKTEASLAKWTIMGEAQEEGNGETEGYRPFWSDGNYSNLVVFVDFADTNHEHTESSWGECLKENPETTFKYFNGSEEYPKGMRQYLYNISYGQLKVENIFPQYDAATDTITPYTLQNNASYYAENRDAMLQEIIEAVNSSGQITSDMKLNLYNGGEAVLDNLTIVVACESGNSNKLFSGVMTTYFGSEKIAGNLVRKYNVVTESGIYYNMSNSGLIIHEFMHTLGYPDLYRNGSGLPVGTWDIMSSESTYVQYPLAYMRSVYGGWFTIPELTESRSNITLPAASVTTAENKDSQALILKTDYSDTEFFVVEYRKQGTAYSEEYEVKIPGSGLIVYRINTEQVTNIIGPPDLVYIFRPGDNYNSNGYESGSGNIYNAHLSVETGRCGYGSSNFADSLAEGAITYSDGRNSGIVISNVGSASGDEITFDVTFTEPEEGMWTTVGKEEESGSTGGASYMDAEGNIYFILNKSEGAGLYQYTDEGFVKLGSAPSGTDYILSKYNGVLYLAYTTGYEAPYAKLDRWTGSGWVNVHTSSTQVSYGNLSLCGDDDGIYFAYVDIDCAKVYAVMVTTAGVATTVAGSTSSYAANPSIAGEGGKIAIAYREFFNNDKIIVKTYDRSGNSWKEITNPGLQGVGLLKIYKGMLYLLQSGTYANNYECYLYSYDLANTASTWTQLGNSYFTNVSSPEYDFSFINDNPHVIYMEGADPYAIQVKYLSENGDWTSLGDCVAKAQSDGLGLFAYGGKLYATYINIASTSQRAFIRSNRIEAPVIIIPRYEWVLKYGFEQEDSGGALSVIEETSVDNMITILNSVPLEAGSKIYVGYKGEGQSGTVPASLLTLCGEKGWQLEFNPKINSETVQFSWLIDGLSSEIVYEDYTVSASLIEGDFSVPEELKEEGYLQIEVPGEVPQDATVKLIISGNETVHTLTANEHLYQWLENGGILSLERELTEYSSDEVQITMLLNATVPDSYVITSQATYGWRKVTTEEAEYWRYIEHRTMEPVKGWEIIDGKKCYFDENGYLYEGLHKVGEKWYLFGKKEDETQGILSGLQTYEEKEYYPDVNGVLRTGWQKIEDKWFYFSSVEENYGVKLPSTNRGYWVDIGEDAGELSGRHYYFRNNTSRLKGWQTIDKTRYYFHNDGYAITGWYPEQSNKNAYYFDELGAMQVGYKEVEGEHYYFGTNGIRLTGWRKDNEVWHYFNPEQGENYGKEISSVHEGEYWYSKDDGRYYFVNNKTLATGWKNISGKKYYFDKSGKCAVGTVKIGNALYHFYEDDENQNVLGVGFFEDRGKTYYANTSGVLQTGWKLVNGDWRYFNVETGAEEKSLIENNYWAKVEGEENTRYYYFQDGTRIATGWKTIEGKKYYFDNKGVLQTGFFKVGNNTYHGNSKLALGEGLGEISVGLKDVGGETYYFRSDGLLLTGFQKIDNEWYFFSTGDMSPERGKKCELTLHKAENNYYWYLAEGKYYCLLRDKTLLKGWQTISGNRYYFHPQTGVSIRECEYTIGKNIYYFNADGVMLKNVVHNGYGYNGSGVRVKGWQKIQNEWHYFDPVTWKESPSVIKDSYWITIESTGETYYFKNNASMLKGWQTIDGKRYYFDSKTGVLQTGDQDGIFVIGKNSYYLGSDGILQTNWIEGVNDKKYYANGNGVILKGWQKIQNEWYYFDLNTGVQDGSAYVAEDNFAYATQDGTLQTYYFINNRSLAKGFRVIDARRYYFDSATGQRKTGFFQVGKDWYYYYEDGKPQVGFWYNTENQNTYYFNTNGKALTGWQTINKSRYYFDTNGVMQKQRAKIGNTYYFFGSSGKMRTGFVKYCDTTYYFNTNGTMQKGWKTIDKKRYYFDEEGAMLTGFFTQGKNTYYLDEKSSSYGQMLTGVQDIYGETYYFNNSGVMLKGWQKLNKEWKYFDAATGKQCAVEALGDGWHKVTTIEASADGTTEAVTEKVYIPGGRSVSKGWQTIGGKRYYFDGNGFLWTKEKGWLVMGSNRFYMQDGDHVHKGFLELEEEGVTNRYYLNGNGQMLKGWQTINKGRYYFDPATGKQLLGHQKIGNSWYYFKETDDPADQMDAVGKMVTGYQQDSAGDYYYYNTNGVLLTGWQKTGDKWHYFDRNVEGENGYLGVERCLDVITKQIVGTTVYDWYTIKDEECRENGTKYCFLNGKILLKGRQSIDKKYYWFHTSTGELYTGYFTIGNNHYYSNEDGSVYTGFDTVETAYGENTYYYNSYGQRITGWLNLKQQDKTTKTYYFNSQGKMMKGIAWVGNTPYVFDTQSGELVRNASVKIGNVVYNANKSGILVY